MHLACVNLRMTMAESLVAATINAAASLGRAHSHGSLEPGKVADMLVIDAPRYMGLVPLQGGGPKHFHLCVARGGGGGGAITYSDPNFSIFVLPGIHVCSCLDSAIFLFRWEHLIYQLGGHDEIIKFAIKNGKIVYSRPH